MSFLRTVCRFIFGVVFILSGFLKAIDPIGTSLKVKEYFGAFHLDFLDSLGILIGILLSVFEFIVGVAILKGLRFKLFSKLALFLVSFFTILTLIVAIFNPIKDCGCFGEAIHLTNWQTFFKNIILLAIAVFLYLQRKKCDSIASKRIEWRYIFCYLVLILGFTFYSFRYLPKIEFGQYSVCTDLIKAVGANQEREYSTTFIYEKNGKRENFTLDNIPDSTWTFIDSKTIQISGETESVQLDFALKDSLGEYVSAKILQQEEPIFFISFYNIDAINSKKLNRIIRLYDTLLNNNAKLYILSANDVEVTQQALSSLNEQDREIPIYYLDYKSIISLNRSNGGLTYVKDGIIVEKWTKRYPFKSIKPILSKDSEILAENNKINGNLFFQLSIILIFALIALLRYITILVYRNLRNKAKKRAEQEKKEKEKQGKKEKEDEESNTKSAS